ncbi:hypothetical protein C8R46DRAFT_1056995 [Mycena filopes]|nr:hypothetical protein C8R46DRAFT_1056995 [Mycena filopes]
MKEDVRVVVSPPEHPTVGNLFWDALDEPGCCPFYPTISDALPVLKFNPRVASSHDRINPAFDAAISYGLSESLKGPTQNLRPRYSKSRSRTLLQLVQSMHNNFERGDPYAFYHEIILESPGTIESLMKCLVKYEVPFIKPNASDTPPDELRSIREAGIIGTKHMLMDLKRLGPDIDFNQAFAQKGKRLLYLKGAKFERVIAQLEDEVRALRTTCKKLADILRRWVFHEDLKSPVESLLEAIRASPALENVGRIRGLEGFTELYFHFCESALLGDTTVATIIELQEWVKEELETTNEQLRDLNTLKQRYLERGRHDLKLFLQQHAETARKAGYRDNVSSEEESRQISEILDGIDTGIATISDTLKRSQQFWQDIDQKLKSAKVKHQRQQQAKDPPPLEVQQEARRIASRLRTVAEATQQYTGRKKILDTGVDLVNCAAALTVSCGLISGSQSMVETQLSSGAAPGIPGQKMARKVLTSFIAELSGIVKGYDKLSGYFTKYAKKVSLLFWFAAERPQALTFDARALAHAVVASHGLSPHQIPVEAAFVGIEGHLRGIQKIWEGVVSDGRKVGWFKRSLSV